MSRISVVVISFGHKSMLNRFMKEAPMIHRHQQHLQSLAVLLGIFATALAGGCFSDHPSGQPILRVNDSVTDRSSDVASTSSSVSIVLGQEPSAEQRAKMIAAKDVLFQKLSSRLLQVMGTKGPVAAIDVCYKEASEIAKEVSQSEEVLIGRSGVRLRNPDNQPPAWALPLTEARTENPTFVMLSNGHAGALLPIKLQSLCRMCHGPPEQIAPAVQKQLAKWYPNDEATGFEEGELRGWFWVETPPG